MVVLTEVLPGSQQSLQTLAPSTACPFSAQVAQVAFSRKRLSPCKGPEVSGYPKGRLASGV